jgi:hypothetical protein
MGLLEILDPLDHKEQLVQMVLETRERLVFKDILVLLAVKVLLVLLEILVLLDTQENWEILEIRAQEEEDQLAKLDIMEGPAQLDELGLLVLVLPAHKEYKEISDQLDQAKLVKWE